MKKINIIRYPNYFVPKTKIRVFPSGDYYFKCTFNQIEFEIKWYENTESEQKNAKELMSFLYSIFENILEDNRVKNLPESKRYRL